MEQLRIGVIGTGRMGRAHLERLCTAATGCRVTAVSASRHGEEAAAVFGVPLVLSPEALIDSPETDAVLVTSPAGRYWMPNAPRAGGWYRRDLCAALTAITPNCGNCLPRVDWAAR